MLCSLPQALPPRQGEPRARSQSCPPHPSFRVCTPSTAQDGPGVLLHGSSPGPAAARGTNYSPGQAPASPQSSLARKWKSEILCEARSPLPCHVGEGAHQNRLLSELGVRGVGAGRAIQDKTLRRSEGCWRRKREPIKTGRELKSPQLFLAWCLYLPMYPSSDLHIYLLVPRESHWRQLQDTS